MTASENGRRFLSPRFVVAAVLMLGLGAGLPVAIAALQAKFEKQPIALRRGFETFDVRSLPSFRYEKEMPAAQADSLWVGTDDWFSYGFAPRDHPRPERADVPVILFVTYYNDPRDTVPHTPEVCYRQAGAEIASMKVIPLDVPGFEPGDAEGLLLDIRQPSARLALLYVIVSNGRIYHDRERVRLALGMPGDRYVYFSKIEGLTPVLSDDGWDEAVELCRTMVTEALVELVESHYPTREDVAG